MTFSRRDFLRHLTMAGAMTLLSLPQTQAQPEGRFAPVGKVTAFKIGEWTTITLHGRRGISVRRLPGRKPAFQAVDARCTHKGCTVIWTPAMHQFICPCHQGRYNADGRNIAGPPPSPLRSLPVRVQKGMVSVLV